MWGMWSESREKEVKKQRHNINILCSVKPLQAICDQYKVDEKVVGYWIRNRPWG